MQKIRILYLEHNGIDTELVTLSLADHSYSASITSVDDKQSFSDAIVAEQYDLILMDYDAPTLTASDAIGYLKTKKVTVPIIVICGEIGYEAVIQLIKLGAYDCILKKHLATLPAAIQRALNEYQDTQTKQQEHTSLSQLSEHELRELSMHDALTGLPNRRYFTESLQMMIHECERGLLSAFAVFYMDLDHFKTVNDELGHPVGDALLKQASARFQSIVRKYDIIARIGGDEFLLVLKHIKSMGEIAFVADNLLTSFREPFHVNGHDCLTTLSIGVAYVNNTSSPINAEKIIQKADQALYRAKARGRNCYEIYTENISHEIQHTAFLENALRNAIAQNELHLVFQPQIDLMKSAVFGFEVLVRWHQAVYGDIPSNIFLPIAEETEQMNTIGNWIVDTALLTYQTLCAQIPYFEKHHVMFSINVSATQLLQPHFVSTLLQKIQNAHILPKNITFEITETSIIQNLSQIKKQFLQEANQALQLGVDDFGVGYSSFTHLKELPITILKLDQSFVQELEHDDNCKNIIKSVISLAKSMHITLIAEGVENAAQKDFLLENGCALMQGFYFARPMTVDQIAEYIKEFRITE